MGFFEAIDNVDNPLHRFAGALASGWTRMFGSRNDRLIREILPKVDQINALEAEVSLLSDAEIQSRIATIREQIQQDLTERGAPALEEESFRMRMDGRPEEADEIDKKYQKLEQSVLDGVLVDTFALIREAGKRTLGQRHYDVQLVGGIALHNGWIAEMVTGEGLQGITDVSFPLLDSTGFAQAVLTMPFLPAARQSVSFDAACEATFRAAQSITQMLGGQLPDLRFPLSRIAAKRPPDRVG